jgi:hypothetical protein
MLFPFTLFNFLDLPSKFVAIQMDGWMMALTHHYAHLLSFPYFRNFPLSQIRFFY